MKIIIEDEARDRVLEYYKGASVRHSIDARNAVRKVIADMKGIAPLYVTAKKPAVLKWQRRGYLQIVSQNVHWCYGVWEEGRGSRRTLHIQEAEHQDNMADESFPMQEEQ